MRPKLYTEVFSYQVSRKKLRNFPNMLAV